MTRYSSAHLDRANVMAENVWHLGRATRYEDRRPPALLMICFKSVGYISTVVFVTVVGSTRLFDCDM